MTVKVKTPILVCEEASFHLDTEKCVISLKYFEGGKILGWGRSKFSFNIIWEKKRKWP